MKNTSYFSTFVEMLLDDYNSEFDLFLEAEEKSSALEYQLFVEVREQVKHYTAQLQQLAKTVATIDVLQAFSVVSERYYLVKPTISMKNRRLWIEDGRHPVVEKGHGDNQRMYLIVFNESRGTHSSHYWTKYVW